MGVPMWRSGILAHAVGARIPSLAWGWAQRVEKSPSPVYGARLLSGLRTKILSRVQIPPSPPRGLGQRP